MHGDDHTGMISFGGIFAEHPEKGLQGVQTSSLCRHTWGSQVGTSLPVEKYILPGESLCERLIPRKDKLDL